MPAAKGDCIKCRLPEQACICPLIPRVESAACFWLITHDKEFDKPTNTGKLIQVAIPGSRLFNWSRTAPDEQLLRLLDVRPGYQYCCFQRNTLWKHRVKQRNGVIMPDLIVILPSLSLMQPGSRPERCIVKAPGCMI